MDVINIIPALWDMLAKRKLAINVTNIDNELAVSIIGRRKIKRFKNKDSEILLSDIRSYLGA